MPYARNVTIPFRLNMLILSLSEAKELHDKLATALEEYSASDDLNPPRTVDGYIGRPAIYEFFSQIYDGQHPLNQHAGRIYARLTRGVQFGHLDIEVRCSACHAKNDAHEASCSTRVRSTVKSRETQELTKEMSVNSLLALSSEEVCQKISNVGQAFKADLETLIDHLPRE